MDSKQAQLEEYRRQLAELTQKIDALAAESAQAEPAPTQAEPAPAQPTPVQPQPTPAQPQNTAPTAWQQQNPPAAQPQNGGVPHYYRAQYTQPRNGNIPPYYQAQYTQPQSGSTPPYYQAQYTQPRSGNIPHYYQAQYPQPQNGSVPPYQPTKNNLNIQHPPVNPQPSRDREGVIGRNLFAILASLLILVGVSIFISTIYEYIPTPVKVIAIYAFGITMLGAGLLLYRRNKNNFWLGVASCGLAELLICIITSHSYFEILPLPATFALILVWILGSFWLTKVHPVVFKAIGYMGFIISLWLGSSLLEDYDLPIYMTLLISYAVLSVFFMVTNRSCTKINTAIAFVNVFHLWMFLDIDNYTSESAPWLGLLLILLIVLSYHGAYLLQGGLSKNAYPFFAAVSNFVLIFFFNHAEQVLLPVMLLLLLVQWFICNKLVTLPGYRMVFSGLGIAFLCLLSMGAYFIEGASWLWFGVFTAAAYVLYYLTKKRDIAWVGFAAFFCLSCHVPTDSGIALAITFAAALGFFALTNSKLLRHDGALQTAWYAMTLLMAYVLKSHLTDILRDSGMGSYDYEQLLSGVFFLVLAVINTAYLHSSLTKKAALSPKSVLILVIQGILLLNCLLLVASNYWVGTLLGVVSSLLIVSYSLHHVLTTKARNTELLMWQFIKFTLYCFVVLALLNSPSILVHFFMLVIAVIAIIVGLRLDYKAVRIYGLVLSLLDVTALILFNIDYSNSLQFSLGIVGCGVLCFVISFIYSRIAKSTSDSDDPKDPQ